MRRYFAREPRYSREELERQAQRAIDAQISLGRPPAEDFLAVERRLAEMDRGLAARPHVEPQPERRPFRIHEVRLHAAAAPPAPARPAPPKAKTAPAQQSVAARTSAN